MSVTLTIDETLLREAEKTTHIHGWLTANRKKIRFSNGPGV